MAITISDKVGQKPPCINLPDDVLKIKKALNQISTIHGGLKESPPHQKMDEANPIMDQKTLEAIQKFQLKQFGWKGADRRIFPGGQTITRINELLPEETETPESEAKSNIFFIQLSPKEQILSGDSIYLIIDDIQNRQRAKFKVIKSFSMPEIYTNQQRILWKGKPISLKEFDNADFEYYTTASTVTNLENGNKTVETESEMQIKPINHSGWNKFQTTPFLAEPLIIVFKGNLENRESADVTRMVKGKLTLIEFESS